MPRKLDEPVENILVGPEVLEPLRKLGVCTIADLLHFDARALLSPTEETNHNYLRVIASQRCMRKMVESEHSGSTPRENNPLISVIPQTVKEPGKDPRKDCEVTDTNAAKGCVDDRIEERLTDEVLVSLRLGRRETKVLVRFGVKNLGDLLKLDAEKVRRFERYVGSTHQLVTALQKLLLRSQHDTTDTKEWRIAKFILTPTTGLDALNRILRSVRKLPAKESIWRKLIATEEHIHELPLFSDTHLPGLSPLDLHESFLPCLRVCCLKIPDVKLKRLKLFRIESLGDLLVTRTSYLLMKRLLFDKIDLRMVQDAAQEIILGEGADLLSCSFETSSLISEMFVLGSKAGCALEQFKVRTVKDLLRFNPAFVWRVKGLENNTRILLESIKAQAGMLRHKCRYESRSASTIPPAPPEPAPGLKIFEKPTAVISEEVQLVYTDPKSITKSAQCVDFTRPELCAQTRPLTCTIKGRPVVPSKQNWSQLLVAITEMFLAEANPNLQSIDRKPLYGSKMFFLRTKADSGTCSLLSNGMWIYTNYSPQIILTIIRNLCQHCGVDLDDIVVTSEPLYDKPTHSVQPHTPPAEAVPIASPRPALDPEIIQKLTDVLSGHFANGYRLNSPIELERFRSFAKKDLGDEIALPDQELKRSISACGTTYDGKVYAVSEATKKRIKELVNEYFSEGARAIFFGEFYAKNEDWLFEASVVSEDMLINILHELFPKLSFTLTYFGYTDASVFATLEGEILRVWGDEVLLTYGQLAERLRYIPIERIKSALGQNGEFIWSSVETFSHVSRIEITKQERDIIRETAVQECNADGYASITALPLLEIQRRNYELSVTALHNAVYRICLSDEFDKKGKIISRKGDVIEALTIMKVYCRSVDKCSLDDLMTYQNERTGEEQRSIAIEAGNTVLVRVDKNTYVADRYVHFNADIIDQAIGLVVGDYLPLKSFTTFGAFPDCGQTWNLFLLESYCRRFSRKFRFDAPFVNSRNAGAVIRQSCGMDYTEIMADAVANNSDVPLTGAVVAKFLFESGYTGSSTTAKVAKIIHKAKTMRERRN